MDPSWAETGDRYLLKLFRDYVFHQVYEDGAPVIDWGHVVECLNKVTPAVFFTFASLCHQSLSAWCALMSFLSDAPRSWTLGCLRRSC